MQRILVAIVLVSVLATGCAVVSSMLSDPEWSENYALKGECNVEQMVDGSMYTTGKTQPPEYVKGERADDSRFNDVILTLKEPKDIRRINIRRRSEDTVAMDLDIYAWVDGEWQISKEVRGAVGQDNEKGNDVDIRVKMVTDRVKIRAQRATRTAKGKSALSKTGVRTTEMERALREPIVFAEIELYGLKESEAVASEE